MKIIHKDRYIVVSKLTKILKRIGKKLDIKLTDAYFNILVFIRSHLYIIAL